MNRFEKDDFNKEIDELFEQVKLNYIKKVQEDFLVKAQKEYNKYKLFSDNEVLDELFHSSIFYSLIHEDSIFVMDYDMSYWVEHIIDEINKMVDFEQLELKNVQEDSEKSTVLERDKELQMLLQSITFEVVPKEKMDDSRLIRNFAQHNYVKHKKKFFKEKGVWSQATVSLKNIAYGLSDQILEIVTSTFSNTTSQSWDQEIFKNDTYNFWETNEVRVPRQSAYTEDYLIKENCIENKLHNGEILITV